MTEDLGWNVKLKLVFSAAGGAPELRIPTMVLAKFDFEAFTQFLKFLRQFKR